MRKILAALVVTFFLLQLPTFGDTNSRSMLRIPKVSFKGMDVPKFNFNQGPSPMETLVLLQALQIQKDNEERARQIRVELNRVRDELINIRTTIVRLQRLAEKVVPPHPGLTYPVEVFLNETKANMGYAPEIIEYRRLLQANQDHAKEMIFPDIVRDTLDQRAVAWERIIGTFNDWQGKYHGSFYENLRVYPVGDDVVEFLYKGVLMSPEEIGRSAIMTGGNFTELKDAELMAALYEGNNRKAPKENLEAARNEAKKRGLKRWTLIDTLRFQFVMPAVADFTKKYLITT
jgi:hypothetical protein